MVVKWSACSPAFPTIQVRILLNPMPSFSEFFLKRDRGVPILILVIGHNELVTTGVIYPLNSAIVKIYKSFSAN